MTDAGGVSITQVERKAWVLTGLLLAASLLFRSPPVTLGAALGAGLAILNFKGLRGFVSSLVDSGRTRLPRWLLLLYLLKYLFTGVAIFFAIKYDFANVAALLAGVSVIFLAVCWEGWSSHLRMKEGADHAVKL